MSASKEIVFDRQQSESDRQVEEQVMNEVLTTLQQEQPKIDQSLKNFLSVMIGKYSSSTIDPKMKHINLSHDHPPNTNTTTVTDKTEDSEAFPSSHTVFTKATINFHHFHSQNLFTFVKLILQTLQELELPTISEYTLSYPQEQDEKGIHYLNKILSYKGIYFLRQKLIQEKQKISKFFGKSYLIITKIWPKMKDEIIKKAKSLPLFELTDEEIHYLLTIYEKSIYSTNCVELNGNLTSKSPSPSVDTTAARKEGKASSGGRGELEDGSFQYYDLIWSKNFQETLQQYQKKRQEQLEHAKYDADTANQNETENDDQEEDQHVKG